ncbi:ABC transporter permease [Calidifontibacter indicus]|uniref:ABC-2 type transport system permease protein n=1 Tax=Calidifontibacter indicus TaxID=419650 RepID=A0A3D9UVX0_9MICO|nr:ABC transporter permease [Calidifontibacter indicus]REF32110.1 ABC-2 type transport system permease protein [Calidifontibacter indicus]
MNIPILRLAIRSLFGRARAILLFAIPLLLVALAVLLRATAGDAGTNPEDAPLVLVRTFGIGIVVPVVALIATTTLINSEFDDGSIIYLLTKPVSRLSIVASKALVVLVCTLVFAALPMTLAALLMIGTDADLWLGALLGGIVSSVAYAGIFTTLATLLNRSLVGCLIYWLVWESTLTSFISPAAWLSARAWGSSVLHAVADVGQKAHPPVWFGLVAAALCLVGGVVVAGRKLSHTTISDV